MRLKKEIADFLREYTRNNFTNAGVYLFGSRTNDDKKGGDIDILLLTDNKLEFRDVSKMRSVFHRTFGEQKIDIVNFTYAETDPFKEIALEQAIRL